MPVILGTWNLQVYPPRHSARGNNLAQVLGSHTVDVWFLTELHADWEMEGYTLGFSQHRAESDAQRCLSAIASRWDMEPVFGPGDPEDRWICLAHLTDPFTGLQLLAVSSVLPWRGMALGERHFHGRQMTYSEAFQHVLLYTVQRVRDERRPGEQVVWGGDFNQSLSGTDYVGTNRGRAVLLGALDRLGLRAVTSDLPAHMQNHPAIDHICVPSGWPVHETPAVCRPVFAKKPLSDHALYLVKTQPQ